MKFTKTLIIVIFLFFLMPFQTYAYSGQYPWDPLYVEIEQDPLDQMLNGTTNQRSKNQTTITRLKTIYGVSVYYECYPCTYKDTSNPYIESSCLIQTEYCLEKKQMEKENKVQYECATGYVYYNNRCVTYDSGCKEIYGQNAYYTGVIKSNGNFECDCIMGYEWEGDVCVKKIKQVKCGDGFIMDDDQCITKDRGCKIHMVNTVIIQERITFVGV